jgi:hypothetical protein
LRWRHDPRNRFVVVADYYGDGMPYHYAVVDVRGEQLEVAVRSSDGTPLPVPQGWSGG